MDRMGADESEEDASVNAIGAAAQSLDLNVAQPVSGMPVGGPHDLGKKSESDGQERED